MPTSLTKDQRKLLSDITLKAREVAETAARAALENLAVHEGEYRGHMTVDQRQFRNRLRARGRALGDRLDQRSGTQATDHLAESAAYEHWHRLLFTRFLAENHLLHTDEANGTVPVTLEECDELAPELGTRDGFDLACRFASGTLPGVFRRDDPVLELRLAPNHEVQLRQLLDRLPAELFRADDALGWTYQFWQTAEKKRINDSGVKIGADELSAVTQLFTEDYMVEFLLHNSLGAWWAGKRGPVRAVTEEQARSAVALRAKDGLPDIEWNYLRFIQTDDGTWTPAAGTFDGWPKHAGEIRLLDPCMGSGHFLVFALPILSRLRMEEEGLGAAQAVVAVLRDNLHGLEVDERCTQIAAFNVALTAWRLGNYQPLPPFQLACSGLSPQARLGNWVALAGDNDRLKRGMERLYALFQDAPILGSLINPHTVNGDLLEAEFRELTPLLTEALEIEEISDNEAKELAVKAKGLAKAAEILTSVFTLVITNVPYLLLKKQDATLKRYAQSYASDGKMDLATIFLQRNFDYCHRGASIATVTPQNWLFLTSYGTYRERLFKSKTWRFIARLGAKAFQTPMWDFNILLSIFSSEHPAENNNVSALDVADTGDALSKALALRDRDLTEVGQKNQLDNPDCRFTFRISAGQHLLQEYANSFAGIQNGDSPRFQRFFWEVVGIGDSWNFQQATVSVTMPFGGREQVIFFDRERGHLREDAKYRREKLHDSDQRGNQAWNKSGVVVSQMNELMVTLYTGDLYDQSCAVILPHNKKVLAAIWAFSSSPEFNQSVRLIDQKLNVTNSTLVKVPFDLAHWQKVAAEKYPNGLPKPHSDDPTQWLFNGHPKGSEQPLQVAVARLLGYRWPRQTGSEFPDCSTLGPDGLESYADADGIVCLPPINREQPAAARLRNLLAAAFGSDWSPSRERDLLAATGARQTNLEDWLRDAFFEQHCKLFKNRPFIWHLWDGRKDGFHVLVNYHRLDHAMLQKLTYSYLGDWIRQQDADAKADKPGAAERLGAAQALEAELIKILQGEPPYDIFIRWKPIQEQPLGWQPDLNDGVRLNIRPFMLANDVGRRGAGILRFKPNIKWDKDRGKEPYREKAEYPWFWHTEEPPLSCPGGPDFTGHRWNNVHLTLARKRAVRLDHGHFT